MLRNFKVTLIVLVLIVIAGGAYAFAAANTVEASAGGYSANVVSGYIVSDVVYDLNATNPNLVDQISFNIEPETGDVVAALVKVQTKTGQGWIDCVLGEAVDTSKAVTCDCGLTLDLANVEALNVVASSTIDTTITIP